MYIYDHLFTVFTNATDKFSHLNNFRQEALQIFDTFEKYEIKPNQYTYRSLIRMHIYGKDIQSALNLKEDMVKMVIFVCLINFSVIYS
jgi:hypothetical protein